jgi:hypothetical protein
VKLPTISSGVSARFTKPAMPRSARNGAITKGAMEWATTTFPARSIPSRSTRSKSSRVPVPR